MKLTLFFRLNKNAKKAEDGRIANLILSSLLFKSICNLSMRLGRAQFFIDISYFFTLLPINHE